MALPTNEELLARFAQIESGFGLRHRTWGCDLVDIGTTIVEMVSPGLFNAVMDLLLVGDLIIGYAVDGTVLITVSTITPNVTTSAITGLPDGNDLVKVSVADITASFLQDKIESSSGKVTFAVSNPGANEKLDLDVPGIADEQLKVTTNDTTPDFLESKLSSTSGKVSFAVLNPGADETLDLDVVGIADEKL